MIIPICLGKELLVCMKDADKRDERKITIVSKNRILFLFVADSFLSRVFEVTLPESPFTVREISWLFSFTLMSVTGK